MVILWAEIVQLAVASAWLRHFGQVIVPSSPEKFFVGYHWAQKMCLVMSLVLRDGLIVLGNDREGRNIQEGSHMAAAAGAGLGILGSVGSTIANVQAAYVTAKSLDARARSIEQQAAFDETQQRRTNKLYLGQSNADAAASGVAITSGSPLLHELDRVKQTEIEGQNIRISGQNAEAATRFQLRMVRKQIPFQIIGGAAQAGSILSMYAGPRYGSTTYTA